MRLVSFDGGRIGVVAGDDLVDVSALAPVPVEVWPPVAMVAFIAQFDALRPRVEQYVAGGPRRKLSSVRLECPIQWPNKVIAYPANYHAHVAEMITGTGLISTYKADGQGFFLKSNSSLSGPADPIVLPAVEGREIHHECELAIVIGKGGRDIAREDALAHVFGYSCLLDIVVRGKEERVMRKSFDTFCPLGPWLVTADEVPDPAGIEMSLTVNGVEKQRARTADLIVDIPAMIRMASTVMTLCPGDIIATGTPAGVGPIADGDTLEITVSHVGSMKLAVVRGAGGGHELWRKPNA